MKKTVNDSLSFKICDICGKPCADWSEEPMAGQDFRLKLVTMCTTCERTFEALIADE